MGLVSSGGDISVNETGSVVSRILGYKLKWVSRLKVADRDMLLMFADHLRSQGLSDSRVAFYLVYAGTLCKRLGKPWRQCVRDDFERVFVAMRDEGLKPGTLAAYAQAAKTFGKFVEYGRVDRDLDTPEAVKWLKATLFLRASTRMPPEYLTAEEVAKMIEAADTLRDKAMLAVGFEAGLRAGELLGLRVGDVAFDQHGAIIHVRGKTGPRSVRLITSVAALTRYMETHPRRMDPEAPLWVTASTNYRGRPLSWNYWNKQLKKIAAAAGIRKRVHNHMLRHGSATEAARYLTDSELKIRYGWTMSSTMPAVYIHLSARDLDDKLLRIYSGRPVKVEPENTPILCPRCGERNTPGTNYCHKCGTPLKPGEVEASRVRLEKLEREVEETKRILLDLLRQNGEDTWGDV